ncbi:MAG: nicotinamide-nucleotide amidohydrolase family protein [Pseudomonadota bacterium]
MSDELYELSERVGNFLLARGHRLATAESCTGGWIAKCITDVAGSSDWFERGFVTYSNESKIEMLGVASSTLHSFGAVSEETVRQMVSGALANSRAQCALAVSGIAGPGGGSPGRPVGTVCLAWRVRNGNYRVQTEMLSGSRMEIRERAATLALEGVFDVYG